MFQYPYLEAQGNLPDILKKALIHFDEVIYVYNIQLVTVMLWVGFKSDGSVCLLCLSLNIFRNHDTHPIKFAQYSFYIFNFHQE